MFAILLKQLSHNQKAMLAIKTRSRTLLQSARFFSHHAYRVHRGPVTTPANPVHPEQRVESTWTVYSPDRSSRRFQDVAAHSRMEKLKIGVPGLTLIRVRPDMAESLGNDVVAHVRVSSNAAEILNSVRVTPKYPFRTLVEFRPPSPRGDITGNLLTEIDLPHIGALQNLAAIGYGDVVIDPAALASSKSMNMDSDYRGRFRARRRSGCRSGDTVLLLAAGGGRLFLDASDSNMQLQVLKLAAIGRSHVYANVKGVDVSRSLELGVVGGEDALLHVTADSIVTPRLKIAAFGTGVIDLSARHHLEATDVKTCAVGSADIRVDGPGPATERPSPWTFRHKLWTFGTNSIDLGSMPTQHTRVGAVGVSDVRVRSRDSLRFFNLGDSVVECVGAVPHANRIRGFRSPTVLETQVNDPHRKSAASALPKTPTAEDAFTHSTRLMGQPW